MPASESQTAPSPDETAEFVPRGESIADRYRVQRKLGSGGGGSVYLADDLKTNRMVAVKLLRTADSRHEGVVARFDREAAAIARLAGHPNIVQVIDRGRHFDGRLYLVMEFVPGRNLWEELESLNNHETTMPVTRACRLVRDVANAVQAAHDARVVHRDLKPGNIMLATGATGHDQLVKVLDFGVAGLMDDDSDGRLTRAGALVGTRDYMAPEQALGVAASPSFDIYSMGVILFETLTGHVPPPNALLAGPREVNAALMTARRDVPAGLSELICACLHQDPALRPKTASEVAARLDGLLMALSSGGPVTGNSLPAVTTGPHATVDEEGSRRPVLIVMVIALVLGVGGGVWWMAGQGATDGVDDGGPEVAKAGVDDSGVAPVAVAVKRDVGSPTVARGSSGGADAVPEPATTDGGPPAVTSARPGTTARPPSKAVAPPDSGDTGGDATGGAAAVPEAKSPRPPKKKKHETAACKAARKAAKSAQGTRKWRDALTQSADKACWRSSTERIRIRTEAMFELRRFEACIRAGEGFTDPQIKRTVDFCKKRLAKKK